MGSPAIARYIATLRQQQGTIQRLTDALADAQAKLRLCKAELSTALAARSQDRTAIAALEAERDALQAIVEALSAGGPIAGGGNPPVGDGTPWTHAYRGRDAEAFKSARPPGWDEARRGMAPRVPTPGRLALDISVDHELADKLFTGPEQDFQKQLISIFHRARMTGGIVSQPHAAPGTLHLDNCGMELDGNDDLKSLLWFLRAYNLREFSLTRSDFQGLYDGDTQRPKEHVAYVNTAGDTLWAWNYVRGTGGKALYDAYRDQPYEQYAPDNVPLTKRPLRQAYGNVFIDTEQDASKGSFTDTVFDGGTKSFPGTVRRWDNVLACAWDYEREQGNNVRVPVADVSKYRPVRSCGLFVHSCYQQLEPYALDLYERRNELWYSAQANHAVGVIRNARQVMLSGICAETEDHRQPFVDIGGTGGAGMQPAERVVIEDCVSATGLQARIWRRDGSNITLPFDNAGGRYIWDGVTETLTEEAT